MQRPSPHKTMQEEDVLPDCGLQCLAFQKATFLEFIIGNLCWYPCTSLVAFGMFR